MGLVSGISGIGCSYLLFNRLGKLRYRISKLERNSASTAHSDLGLSQELSQLKAELNELRVEFFARIVASPPALLGAIAAEPQEEQALGSASTDILTSSKKLGQKIEALIEAINRRDKSMIRDANPTELNITRASEDDIQMGRSQPTSLEVVLGGGSYLHVRLGTNDWLLPTERTLEGFRNHQPPKGIFKFFPRAVASAQVIVAARIMANGDQWLVSESGETAFPG
ncbi:hypothetical protein [Synechococcus sp. CS-603]|uniref:hypothetical protein n=1 Tax=Synechococcus sp. CS-603 TaxID=2847981 RepID=UPI00223BB086|nr:hypothetical protein [Synechococcus sp. CS-603]